MGLPAIPLLPGEKKVVVRHWSTYSDKLPDAATRAEWLQTWEHGNIGLVMGPQSGLVALDIDTDDKRVQGILQRTLPPTPWVRVGAKGMIWLYAHTTGLKTFRIDDADHKRLFELLSDRLQIVVPPSIHPTTQRPYFANCDLVELVRDRRHEIRPLPTNIEEILRDAFAQEGIPLTAKAAKGGLRMGDFVPAGGRDTQLVAQAGLLARLVVKGERSLLEAMGEIIAWLDTFTEKVWGDSIDPQKGVNKLVEFVLRDVTGPRKLRLPPGWDAGLSVEDKERLGLGMLNDDNRKWAANEIVDFIQLELSRPGLVEDADALRRMAEKVAARVAGNPGLGHLEESQILRYLVEATKSRFFMLNDLKKLVIDLRKGEISGDDVTEIARAALTDLRGHGEIRYDLGKLWQWQGSHWKEMDDAKTQLHLSENYGSYPIMRRHNDFQGALKTMRLHAAKPLATSKMAGINFVNGFLTEQLELLPHNQDLGMNYVLSYPYLAELADKCPKWMGMLEAYWGDDPDYRDKVDLLQEAMAVTLFGQGPEYQHGFLLFGVAHSGKSQILEVLKGLMPKGVTCHVAPTEWGDKFAPALMQGKLLNVAGEISESHLIDGAIFKQVITGDTIKGERKFEGGFDFKPTAANWFAGNFLPRSRDSSEGFNRRLMFLKFNKPFTADPNIKILEFHQILLAEEKEAIVAWVVEGMRRLRAQLGYTEPSSHKDCLNRVAERNNSVRFFIAGLLQQGRVRLGQEAHQGLSVNMMPVNDLWPVYQSFCRTGAGVPLAHVGSFFDRLEELQTVFGFKCQRVRSGPAEIPTLTWLTLVNCPAGSR